MKNYFFSMKKFEKDLRSLKFDNKFIEKRLKLFLPLDKKQLFFEGGEIYCQIDINYTTYFVRKDWCVARDSNKQTIDDLKEPILEELATETTKQIISEKYKITQRTVRATISELAFDKPIIAHSGKKGYRLARDYNTLPSDEKGIEIDEVKRTLNELNSRIRKLEKRTKPLMKYLENNYF